MAKIISQLREEASRALLETGTSGVGGLQSGELGASNAAAGGIQDLTFSYRRRNGAGFLHVPTSERLAYASSATLSGADGIGYYPASPLTATSVQDALDELAGLVAGGGPSGIGGTLTPGAIPLASAADELDDSILSQASGKILFGGDEDANLYRPYASFLATDGGLLVNGQLVGADISADTIGCDLFDMSVVIDNTFDSFDLATIAASITKNNANVRDFGFLKIKGTLNGGVSNDNTTVALLDLDTVNTSLTGIQLDLVRLAYGGSMKWTVAPNGDLVLHGGSQTFMRNDNAGVTYLAGGSGASSSDGAMIVLSGVDEATWNGKMRLYSGTGGVIEFYGDTVLAGFESMPVQATPAAPSDGASVNRYFKGTKVIYQYNDGGTIRYKYLEMTGTDATWTHTTTPP